MKIDKQWCWGLTAVDIFGVGDSPMDVEDNTIDR